MYCSSELYHDGDIKMSNIFSSEKEERILFQGIVAKDLTIGGSSFLETMGLNCCRETDPKFGNTLSMQPI